MKNETNQEFRSSGVLILMGLVGLCVVIIATPWNRHMQDSSVDAALQKAEVVGYQVVQIYREAAKSPLNSDQKDARQPASATDPDRISVENLRSTGSMGMDPWGVPFHYRILSSDKQGRVRIVVWSAGPNQKVETAHLANEDTPVEGQPIYAGDDIGVLLNITQN